MTNLKIPITTLCFSLLFVFIINSCDQEGRGFVLPEGEVARGKATFVKLHCNECHSVADIEWAGNPDELFFQLGGNVSKKKTYGELVASVINPSHKIAKQYYGHDTAHPEGTSKMAIYNEVMTIQELVDIVTFLQKEYKIEPPQSYYLDYNL